MRGDNRRDDPFFKTGEFLGIPWFRLYLADSLAQRLPEGVNETDLSRWFLLHLALQAGSGHLRTDLDKLSSEISEWYLPGDIDETLPALIADAAPGIVASGLESGLIVKLPNEDSAADSLEIPRPPLLLTHDGRYLYFLRRRKEEDRFLARLETRSSSAGMSSESVETPHTAAESLFRKLAAGVRLLFLAGGPGTGKTTTIAELLRLLSESQMDIVLAAPTGRAAARMSDSLELSGRTIHSLLGIFPGQAPRHNRDNQLVADLVVVDEASMVDLPLMNALLDALPDDASLLLVGDPDQLPSVEAGALLGDLLYGEARAGSEGFVSPLKNSVERLTRVYRSGTAILAAAAAVREGNLDTLKAAFRDDGEGVSLHSIRDPESMSRVIASEYSEAVIAVEENSSTVFEVFRRFSAHAVLTPLRRGSWGVPAMNDRISRILGATLSPFPGMPVMITKNDPSRGIWNGDRGVVLRRNGRLRAFFPEQDDFRDFPLAALPGWEPAWIQTIHKSQGSEFDGVSVLLPEGAERLLSREILYTAFTRARKSVDLYADLETVEATLGRAVVRNSRIRKWAAGGGSD
jgi:exodeoxyribonuclease V alpha subunit